MSTEAFFTLAAWWNARTSHGTTNGQDALAGIRMDDFVRRIVESRPPDRTWDDLAPVDAGDPYFEETTHHTLFSSWVERERVQPQTIRRFYVWERREGRWGRPGTPTIGFHVAVAAPARRERRWPA